MDVQFTTTTSELLDTIPIVDGQIIALADRTGYYYDMLHERKKVNNDLYIDDDHYSKESLYSSAKVRDLLNNITTFSTQVVEVLPREGQPNVLYLVKKTDVTKNDYCDEYMYIDGKWELLGHTKIVYNVATHYVDGLMSAQDKTSLDDLVDRAILRNGTDPVGSSIQGVYVSASGEVAPMGHTLSADVPPDAVFTDTVTTVTTEGSGTVVKSVTGENGMITVTLGDASNMREVTETEYQSLSYEEKMNGTVYMRKDAKGGSSDYWNTYN